MTTDTNLFSFLFLLINSTSGVNLGHTGDLKKICCTFKVQEKI